MKVDLGLTSRSNTEYIMLYYQIIFSLLDFYVNVARTTTCYKSGWTSMYKVKLDWDQTSIPRAYVYCAPPFTEASLSSRFRLYL